MQITEEELNKLKIKYPEFKKKGRHKDLTNLHFGELIALYRFDESGDKGKCAKWVCQCSCGNIAICDAGLLNSGRKTSCGCKTKELKKIAAKKNFKDLTGKTFGELTVIKHIENPNNTGALFECLCSCGEKRIVKGIYLSNGHIKKCEKCVEKDRHKSRGSNYNLVNKKFGSLLVLQETLQKDNYGGIKWKCQCDCGNTVYITTHSLISGNSKTCGAPIHKAKDITNQRFGKLIALEIINKQDKAGHFYWKCQCDCGNIIETTTHNLVTGRCQSCGCIKSKNQEYISKELKEHKIFFELEKKFNSDILKEKRFDFYVNNQYIIEYDGSQHFKYTGTGWDTKERFERTRKSDLIKNKYCFEHNIPLIRIPYNEEYTIDDLKLETTRFLLTPENEKEYYELRKKE